MKLYDWNFVENNKDKCFLIIDNKINEIIENYRTKEKRKENKLKIKLIEEKYITDMSNIFDGCFKLSSLPDISKWNTYNLTNVSNMFSGCFKLSSLPDISKWNTDNVTNMSDMFYGCQDALNIPNKFK